MKTPDLQLLQRTARQIMDRQQALRENDQAIEDVLCQVIDLLDRQQRLIEEHRVRIELVENALLERFDQRRRRSPRKPKEKS